MLVKVSHTIQTTYETSLLWTLTAYIFSFGVNSTTMELAGLEDCS